MAKSRRPIPGLGTEPDSAEAPNREALATRLEAQRAELLRAISCVDLARRTIEEHRALPASGAAHDNPEEHEVHRQRVLEALNEAGRALATAYPMLESITQALARAASLIKRIEEIYGVR